LRAERGAAAEVHGQEHRQLPLLDIPLDERPSHPRRHVPVDAADVVSRLVFAYFLEGDTRAFENAVVLAAQEVFHGPSGTDMKTAQAHQQLAGEHALMLATTAGQA